MIYPNNQNPEPKEHHPACEMKNIITRGSSECICDKLAQDNAKDAAERQYQYQKEED